MRNEQENFVPWAGGKGPNAWKMNRFLRSTETRAAVEKIKEPVMIEMTEGVEVDLPKNPADLGKGNDLGNNTLW